MSHIAGRFWGKVAILGDDECWEWQAGRQTDGYGSFGVAGKGTVLAHRWAWEFFHGKVDDGLCVLHRCDNPPCVNPTHLFLGTQRDNVYDCMAKGRRNYGHFHKLSHELNEEIVRRYAAGDVSQAQLGREYGVTQEHISGVVRRVGGHQPLSLAERGRRSSLFRS